MPLTPSIITYYPLLVFSCHVHPHKTKTKHPSLSAPTSDDPCPLSGPGLDLCKPSSEVTGVKHVQRQRGNTLQNYSILALALLLQILVLTLDQRVAIAMV